MHETNDLNLTRAVDIEDDETRSEIMPGSPADPREIMNIDQLVASYDDIIRAGAIFYPVSYRFVRELGRGRQGIVYQAARHGARGCITRHSIKLFDPRLYRCASEYWTDMGRIADQITKLHGINSPYQVSRQIYEEVNGIGYIQMETIRGYDLDYLLKGEHLERARARSSNAEWGRFNDVLFRYNEKDLAIQPGIALFIVRSALRGLEPLHRNGFLHSDIKPANIMIDHTGYVKLIDFGRAVRTDEPVRFLFGTPQYMAPELHRRDPGTTQSDLYSVGLVALELLRGRPLMDGGLYQEKDLLEAKLKLHRELPRLLPEHVVTNELFMEVLYKMLAPEPENRYQDVTEAESGSEGLRMLHRQLTIAGKDTQYDRELEAYLDKIINTEKIV